VVVIDACPIHAWMARIGAPDAAIDVPNVCRSECQVTCRSILAAATISR
jgi:hypothetical protein